MLAGHTSRRLGAGSRVDGRAIGEELALCTEDELDEYISLDTLRNGPCLRKAIGDHGESAITVAMLATDQDPPHEGDTLGIARAVARWLRMSHPALDVLDPDSLKLTVAPHRPTPELDRQIREQITAAVGCAQPDLVLALLVGSTPAMRVLIERAASLAQIVGPARSMCLLTDHDGNVREGGLLKLVDANDLAMRARREIAASFSRGELRLALSRCSDLRQLGAAEARRVWACCDTAVRVAENRTPWLSAGAQRALGPLAAELREAEQTLDGWSGLLGARIGSIERAERAGRFEQALVEWVVAAELLQLVWALTAVGGDTRALRLAPAAIEECSARRIHDGVVSKGPARAARSLSICCATRCPGCPVGTADEPRWLSSLWANPLAARAAAAARDTGPRRLVRLRNRMLHARAPGRQLTPRRLRDAISQERDALQELGVHSHGGSDASGLADLLRSAVAAAVGAPLPDPLGRLEAELTELTLRPVEAIDSVDSHPSTKAST